MVCCSSDNSSRHSWQPSEQEDCLDRGAFFNATTTSSEESSCLVSSESSRCGCAPPTTTPTKMDKSPRAMHHTRLQELRRPRRKTVRFSGQCRIRVFEAVSPQRRLWYSQAEYRALREECFSTVRLVKRMLTICEDDHDDVSRKNNEASSSLVSSSILLLVPTSEYTARGLEHLIYEGALEQRHSRRLQSLEAVWFEQLQQRETLWCHDDERIAQVSRSITDACQHDAHVRALQYWNEDHHQQQQDEEEENQEEPVFFLPPRTTATTSGPEDDDDATLMMEDAVLPSTPTTTTTTTTTTRTARKKRLVCARETKKRQLTANCA